MSDEKKKPVQVSRAPEPIRPVSMRGGYSEYVKARPANWAVWRLMPKCELWKAVLLSLDLEPPKDAHITASLRTLVPGERREEFDNRMMVAQASLGYEGPLRVSGPLYRGMLQNPAVPVSVPEFAVFAVRCGWDLPEAMRALGGASTLTNANTPEVFGADAPDSLLVSIDGRQAIPVRAIPHITSRSVPADDVPRYLGRNGEPPRLQKTDAYHGLPGKPRKMLAPEWDRYAADLAALGERLGHTSEAKAMWDRQSIELLPPGVWVWRDEFEADHARDFSHDTRHITGERPGERAINYAPLLEPDLRMQVLAGFQIADSQSSELLQESESTSESSASSRIVNSTLSKRRDSLSPVIESAQELCRDPFDAAEVWGRLLKMAESKDGPLLGSAEDGIQYLNERKGGVDYLSREALRKRLGRAAGRGR